MPCKISGLILNSSFLRSMYRRLFDPSTPTSNHTFRDGSRRWKFAKKQIRTSVSLFLITTTFPPLIHLVWNIIRVSASSCEQSMWYCFVFISLPSMTLIWWHCMSSVTYITLLSTIFCNCWLSQLVVPNLGVPWQKCQIIISTILIISIDKRKCSQRFVVRLFLH